MGAQDHGSTPGTVTVRAGQIVAVGCFWSWLLDAAETGQGNVIADLGDAVYATPRSLEVIGYVSELLRVRRRRLGIVAGAQVRGMIEASDPPETLDVAASAAELAELWKAEK